MANDAVVTRVVKFSEQSKRATPTRESDPNGKRLFEYKVVACENDVYRLVSHKTYWLVVATSPAEAIDLLREATGWPCPVEYIAFGPRGGRTERFTGYETAIYHRMIAAHRKALGDLPN
jgi:hypothetical protein